MKIPFNKPHLTGKEAHYIYQAVYSGKISGNGLYTQKCQRYFEDRYDFTKCLLTTSCTDALEMAAILLDIEPGDEVIMPSYTFVSTANAFVLRGAKIVFADSRSDHPGIDEAEVEDLVTDKTKAIVVVHYAGVACDMDKILEVAERHDLKVVEDAAQAVDSYYKDQPLGGIGHLGTFSFHETKNVISGEGGMLVVNDEQLADRAEIIWEKGTNRSAFFRGEIDKYGWVDIGSSFLPSEVTAAFLWAQLESLEEIQRVRRKIWKRYYEAFSPMAENGNGFFRLPKVMDYSTNNAHMFYLVFDDPQMRTDLISELKEHDILAVFHYLSLHRSRFYQCRHDGRKLPRSDYYSERLLRLPFYNDLGREDQQFVIDKIKKFLCRQ